MTILFQYLGLTDTMTQVMPTSSVEWRDEDSSGTMTAGWNKDGDSPVSVN